jgi:hypothetical protein
MHRAAAPFVLSRVEARKFLSEADYTLRISKQYRSSRQTF